MPSSNITYQLAKSVLGESDLQRLACCFFHTDHTKINYDTAAKDFGAASTASMRVMVNTALRKVRAAGDESGSGSGAATPKKTAGKKSKTAEGETPKQGKAKRTAAAAELAMDEDDDEETAEGTAVAGKKKRGDLVWVEHNGKMVDDGVGKAGDGSGSGSGSGPAIKLESTA